MEAKINLRIHEFYDIIRDFGKGKNIEAHPYGHSFHKIAELIRTNSEIKIKIIVGCDDVCKGCKYLRNEICEDTISHRNDFTSKHEFNNYLDKRIMEVLDLNENEVFTPTELCEKAKLYLENIEFIYQGNDREHTEERKENVSKGLKYYAELQNLKL